MPDYRFHDCMRYNGEIVPTEQLPPGVWEAKLQDIRQANGEFLLAQARYVQQRRTAEHPITERIG